MCGIVIKCNILFDSYSRFVDEKLIIINHTTLCHKNDTDVAHYNSDIHT